MCGKIQCLVPRRLSEHLLPVGGVHIQSLGRGIIASDQGFRQAMGMVDIVITKAALDAQTSLIRGAIDAFDMFNFAILDL